MKFAAEELQGDSEIVLTAVLQDGCSLQCVTEELRGGRENVLAAVQQLGVALQDLRDGGAGLAHQYTGEKAGCADQVVPSSASKCCRAGAGAEVPGHDRSLPAQGAPGRGGA
jgi:hypothetical protein